jgi:8-oxo-dGTP pyrophosphatase MutT (NUDIX family)
MSIARSTREDEAPQQAAAFPVRRTNGVLEVCLIRRKDSAAWGLPKGHIDPGNTAEETALIEALEEAGLEGRLLDRPIGSYRYEKWPLMAEAPGILTGTAESAEHAHCTPLCGGSDDPRTLTARSAGRRRGWRCDVLLWLPLGQ